MKSLLFIGFLVWCTEALICTIGQERDPESGFRYRWVIPVPDPCQCTTLRVGGLITRTPYRPFVVTYMDTINYSEDQEEIQTWLNCTDRLRKHMILNKSLRQDGNSGQCDAAKVRSTEYEIRGNASLVKMVPAPKVYDHACAVYSQTGSYLDLGDFKDTCISDLGLCESMTWSLWLKIDTSSGFTGQRYYISSGGQTGQARGIALLYKSNTQSFYYEVSTVRSKFANRYHVTETPLNTWFHLALTMETNQNVDNVLKLYVDGELRLENDKHNQNGVGVDGCTKLYLGMPNTCSQLYSSDTYSGSAAFSNLKIFDRLLNQDEINNLIKMTN